LFQILSHNVFTVFSSNNCSPAGEPVAHVTSKCQLRNKV